MLEAIQTSILLGDEPCWYDYDQPNGKIPDWAKTAMNNEIVFYHGYFKVKTLKGEMRGEGGDWIIRGIKGELYPCKPDIFEATYETAE